MFSYSDYCQIIDALQKSGKYMSFHEAAGAPDFALMRHDVEFSVDRALALAELEHENGFASCYLFQVSNNAYNILSKKNMDAVKHIASLGHEVGLHFHMNALTDVDQIRSEIAKEAEILSMKSGIDIRLFSIHRPSKEILSEGVRIPGLLNTYDSSFFSFVENIDTEDTEIKYMSDARHRWNYGLIPNDSTINGNRKVQILTHPYSWTQTGFGNLDNFKSLISEKNQELVDTIDGECKHFREIKDAL